MLDQQGCGADWKWPLEMAVSGLGRYLMFLSHLVKADTLEGVLRVCVLSSRCSRPASVSFS